MTIILTRDEMGSNVHLITRHMNNTERVKSSELGPIGDDEVVIRWGCTARVPNGPKIINKIRAIKETTAKGTFRKRVADAGYAPNTWMNLSDWYMAGAKLPVIIRPVFHERSEDLFFCSDEGDLREVVRNLGDVPYYISEYINKDKEWRVFIAQGRVMIVAEKIPENRDDVSWGCVDEGDLEYVGWGDWNSKLIECAVKSFNLTTLDFAAVDIIEKDGEFYFLEMNTAPEVWIYYGEVFAKVFNYMLENDTRERYECLSYNNWREAIHPAVSNRAILRLAEAA